MSYELERAELGRSARLLCEIDLDQCANNYSESRTNLITQPEDFSHADWTDPSTEWSVVSDNIVAPDGLLTADTITVDAGDNSSLIRAVNMTLVSLSNYSISLYLKLITGDITNLTIDAGDGVASSNLSTNLVVDKWVREQAVVVAGASNFIDIQVTFTGSSATLSIWGVQAILGSREYRYGVATCNASQGNLLTRSEEFEHGDWVNAWGGTKVIVANDALSPAGIKTADKFTSSAGAAAIAQLVALTNGVNYTFGFYAARVLGGTESELIQIRVDIDLTSGGEIFSKNTNLPADGSFVRVTGTFSPTSTASWYVGISNIVSGDSGAYIWGAHLFEGSIAPVYTKTVASAIAATKTTACFNTRGTCQDTPNYLNRVRKTYQFVDALVPGESFLHCISGSDLAPTVISPEKGLGLRASMNVSFADFSHHDRGVDPYVEVRNYTPEDQGTFFAKLLARNPHYAGRPLRIKTGYVGDPFDINDFQTRHYVIDNITGPDQRGGVQIRAKDILKLADDKQAEAPAVSTGLLVADILAAATSLTVTSGTEGEYSLEGDYIAIGDEMILSPVANRAANVFGNLTRAQFGSEAADHDLGDQVQACKYLNAVNVVDLVKDLIENYTTIPANFIIDADWNSERDDWFSVATITTLIAKPAGVNKLINSLAEQFYFQIYWHEINQEIVFNSISPPRLIGSIVNLDESANLIADKTRVVRNDDKRLTRVIIYYNPRNPLEFKGPEDFEGLHVAIGADEESVSLFDDKRQKVIFARFVQTSGQAVQTAGRILSRFRAVPRQITFNLDAKDSDHWTGDTITVDSRRLQGVDGANEIAEFQITSAKELTRGPAGNEYQYKGLETNFFGKYGYIGPDTLNDYDTETDDNKTLYGFIAPDTGIFSDNTAAYLII